MEEDEFLRFEMEEREIQQQEEQRQLLKENKERIDLRNKYALEQKTKHIRESEKKRQEQLKKEQRIKSQACYNCFIIIINSLICFIIIFLLKHFCPS